MNVFHLYANDRKGLRIDCLFTNIQIAIETIQNTYGKERVEIIERTTLNAHGTGPGDVIWRIQSEHVLDRADHL